MPNVPRSARSAYAARAYVESLGSPALMARRGAFRLAAETATGRVVARIEIDGVDLGERLIARGLAQPWRGRKADFCSGAWLLPATR